MAKGKLFGRRAERAQAFQVLYSLSFADIKGEEDVRQSFCLFPAPPAEEGKESRPSDGFAWELVRGVWRTNQELDALIQQYARNWRLDRLGRVEKTILQLALYELVYRQDVPPKVSINEALELTRQFGEDNAVSFINGVLDAIVKSIESGELSPRIEK